MGELKMPLHTLSNSSLGSPSAANGGTPEKDNPVEVIKKYIYVIKNDINEKVYVGQAIDPHKRFVGHCQKRETGSIIDGAIKKYGREHFYYVVIDGPIENYNEREKYWIKFYDSVAPNGYNIQLGGEDPPIRREFENNQSVFKSYDDIYEVLDLLRNKDLTLIEIAKYKQCSVNTIKAINKGLRYKIDGVKYPVRDFRISGEHENMVTQKQVDEIIEVIKKTDMSMREIAEMFNIGNATVDGINNGTLGLYRRENEDYPIRGESVKKRNRKLEKTIKEELKRGLLSKNQIASKYGIPYGIVSSINSGRCYFDPDIVYPIKKHEGKFDIDEKTISEIKQMLRDGVKIKTIVNKLHLPNYSFVHAINTGRTYHEDNIEYPIQKIQNRFSDDMIRRMENDIINTGMSLTEIAKKYGVNKSVPVYIKNGSWLKYRNPDLTYPLRPNR